MYWPTPRQGTSTIGTCTLVGYSFLWKYRFLPLFFRITLHHSIVMQYKMHVNIYWLYILWEMGAPCYLNIHVCMCIPLYIQTQFIHTYLPTYILYVSKKLYILLCREGVSPLPPAIKFLFLDGMFFYAYRTYIHIYIHTCTYIHTYIHTHIHTIIYLSAEISVVTHIHFIWDTTYAFYLCMCAHNSL